MKILLFIFMFSSVFSASSQSNELVLDSIFHRSNVGDFFEKGLEYFQMPEDQMRPIECSALVSNTGENDITNCYLAVDVIKAGTTLYTFFSDSVFIAGGNQDSLQINAGIDLIGEELGLYTFEYTVFSDSLEGDYSNNKKSFRFGITEHLLSRSDFAIMDSTKNAYPDSLGISSFGYAFKMENDACLGAIYPWMTYSPVNSESSFRIDGTLYVLDTMGVNNFSQLGRLGGSVATDEELGGSFRMNVEFTGVDDHQLESGKTYLITVNTYSQAHDFYLSQETIDSTIFHSYTDGTPGSGFIEAAPLSNSRMIKMDIEFSTGYLCNVGIEKTARPKLIVYPNPSTNQITVEYAFEAHSILRIVNLNGQIIKEVSNLDTSLNSIIIDTKGIAQGYYFIRIISEKQSVAQRIVIQ